MKSKVAGRWLAVFACAWLAACGGGGGGSGGGSNATLTFTPSPLTANVARDGVTTLTVNAVLSDPGAVTGNTYVVISAPEQLISSSVGLSQVDDTHFVATLYTQPGLSAGHHTGTFNVRLCKDAQCGAAWPVAPAALPYDLDVEGAPMTVTPATSTTLSVGQGGRADPVNVAIAGGGNWTASTGAPWLKIVGSASGASPGSLQVGVDLTGLAQGDYTSAVTIASADGQSSQVPVTLHVVPVGFSIEAGIPTFAAINGAPIPAQTLGFQLNTDVAAPWSLSSDAPWLRLGATSGTTPATVSLQPDPSVGPMASGAYDAHLSLTSPGVPALAVTSHLQLTVPTLGVGAQSLTFGGTLGRDPLDAQTLQLTLNTAPNSYPFSIGTPPAWLAVSADSATVGANQATLTFAPGASTPVGSTSASVQLHSTVHGDVASAPVTVNVNRDQRRLMPSTWGVGLASSPTGTVLSRTLTMGVNFGDPVAWTAVSDSAWLTATASGSTDASPTLVLSADPSALADGSVSVANVVVSSTAAGVAPATVRVGLWKSSSGLTTAILAHPAAIPTLVADRIRPFVYATTGGSGIDVWNAYTGAKVATVANVGNALGGMGVSPDGSTLYVIDTSTASVVPVDLATLTAKASWRLHTTPASPSWQAKVVRPGGVDIVIAGDSAYDASGRWLRTITSIIGPMAATDDGKTLYLTNGYSPAGATRVALDYSAIAGGTLAAAVVAPVNDGGGSSVVMSNGQDIAVSGDGSHLYAAFGYPYACQQLDTATRLSLMQFPNGSNPYPNNVEVAWDGRVVCGISSTTSTSPDFWVFSPGGVQLGAYHLVAGASGGLQPAGIVLTPDGFVAAASVASPALAFVPIAH